MLDMFREAKVKEVASLIELNAKGAMPPPYAGPRPSLVAGLKAAGPLPVIAEYKRASPSRGDINLAATPEDVALAYANAGAGAISVLTEEVHFKGSLDFLARMAGPGLPLLRKDFILHPLQVARTAATPASALLVIVRMINDAALNALLREAARHGLEVVTEVFSEADLERAQRASASIIQVNNRDLDSLKTDLAVSRSFVERKQAREFWITASGIESHERLASLLDLGFDAALVGTSLMRGNDPGRELAGLLHGGRFHA